MNWICCDHKECKKFDKWAAKQGLYFFEVETLIGEGKLFCTDFYCHWKKEIGPEDIELRSDEEFGSVRKAKLCYFSFLGAKQGLYDGSFYFPVIFRLSSLIALLVSGFVSISSDILLHACITVV